MTDEEIRQFYEDSNKDSLHLLIGNYLVNQGYMSFQTVCREIVRKRPYVNDDILELENKLIRFCIENKHKDVTCLLRLVKNASNMNNISRKVFSSAFSTISYSFDISLDSIFGDYFKRKKLEKMEIRETLVNYTILKYGIGDIDKKEQNSSGNGIPYSDLKLIAILSIILNLLLIFMLIYLSLANK